MIIAGMDLRGGRPRRSIVFFVYVALAFTLRAAAGPGNAPAEAAVLVVLAGPMLLATIAG